LGAKALGRRKQMKTYLAEEGGDRSDMRDYGPFSTIGSIISCQEIEQEIC
jgi:vancomycin permeability regulator SanA